MKTILILAVVIGILFLCFGDKKQPTESQPTPKPRRRTQSDETEKPGGFVQDWYIKRRKLGK